MRNFLKKVFDTKSTYDYHKDQAEQYLSEAQDLVDLEHRQRLIDRGQAPWQTRINHNLQGWI